MGKKKFSLKHPPTKTVNKIKHPSVKETECFVLVNGEVYAASTTSERNQCTRFEKEARKAVPVSISLESYVQKLTISEKKALFSKLQEELKDEISNRVIEQEQETYEEKYLLLKKKLEQIEEEINFNAEKNIQAVKIMHTKKEIDSKKKEEKILKINKYTTTKIKTVECTKKLFKEIFFENAFKNKQEEIDEILRSLKSFSSLDQLQENYLESERNSIKNSLSHRIKEKYSPKKMEDEKNICIQEEIEKEFYEKEELMINKNKFENSKNEQEEQYSPFNINKIPFKKEEQVLNSEKNISPYEKEIMSLEENISSFHEAERLENLTYLSIEEESENIKNKLQIVPSFFKQNEEHQLCAYNDDISEKHEFESSDFINQLKLEIREDEVNLGRDSYDEPEESSSRFEQETFKNKTSMVMTKEYIRNIEIENKHRELERMKKETQLRMSIQQSDLETPNEKLFTTLMAVNQYLMDFYNYFMSNQMEEMLERLNTPYGKAVIDKLYSLKKFESYESSYVFNEHNFEEFLMYMRGFENFKEEEVIHQKAIFDAFNKEINFYRPYFELEGELYPWIISEKALTFYEINDRNIEEVFEKTKSKVLESCATLCGLFYEPKPIGKFETAFVEQRNEEIIQRMNFNEINEHFSQWNIKIMDYDTFIKLLLFDAIFEDELLLFVNEMAFY